MRGAPSAVRGVDRGAWIAMLGVGAAGGKAFAQGRAAPGAIHKTPVRELIPLYAARID